MAKVGLFLGAGASSPFDYPTTEEFLYKLKSQLSGEHKRLLAAFSSSSKIRDIEHVLIVLDNLINLDSNQYVHAALSEFEIVAKTKGASSMPITIDSGWANFMDSCKSLKESILNELYKHYGFKPTSLESAIRAYDELFRAVSQYAEACIFDIFTTNYDRLMEEYCYSASFKLVDGFSLETRIGGRFWNPKQFDEYSDNSIRLFKLHGSLNWRKTHDGKLESVRTEERCLTKGTFTDNIIIYPTQQRPLEEPFTTLFDYFEKALKNTDVFVVIGYSFRDTYINEMFDSFLKNIKHRLVVISPTAKENVRRLRFSLEQKKENKKRVGKALSSRLITLNCRFAEKTTPIRLYDTLISDRFA